MTTSARSRHPQLPGTIAVSDDGRLTATVGSTRFEGRAGSGPGQVANVCLWSARATVLGNWSGPGGITSREVFDLVLLVGGNRVLARLPAGGGWVEGHRDSYVAGWGAPNWAAGQARLLPVWSGREVRRACEAAGVGFAAGRTVRPLWALGDVSALDDLELPTPELGAVSGAVAGGFRAPTVKRDNGLLAYAAVPAALFAFAVAAIGAAGGFR